MIGAAGLLPWLKREVGAEEPLPPSIDTETPDCALQFTNDGTRSWTITVPHEEIADGHVCSFNADTPTTGAVGFSAYACGIPLR
jgi:hypothetical protein